MPLRVNTNATGLTALRLLQRTDRAQQKSLERLSTGLRINQASDDPAGLVISERLRSQVVSIQQAMENSQQASNMINTSEAALNEMHSLLLQIRESIVFALNTGGNSPEQIDAEQDSVDNILMSIDRIAQTTSYANRRLLDGSSAISTTSTVGSAISDLNVQSVQFDSNSQLSFSISIDTVASQAGTLVSSAYTSAANGTVVRLTGNLGTEDISLASSINSASEFDDAINALTGTTGVYASSGSLFSVDYGSEATISLEVVSGTVTLNDGSSNSTLTSSSSVQTDEGVDVGAYINGMEASGSGNTIRVVSSAFTGDVVLEDGTNSSSDTNFTIEKSGLVFQLNGGSTLQNRERIGIRSMDSSYLGMAERSVNGIGSSSLTIGGYLSSLMGGDSNDLNSNADNALRIVDAAIDDVSDARAYLGSFKAQTLDTNFNSLSVAFENLVASESSIRDLDFAQETMEFSKQRILFQSGIAVLSQTNLMAENVLSLLT